MGADSGRSGKSAGHRGQARQTQTLSGVQKNATFSSLISLSVAQEQGMVTYDILFDSTLHCDHFDTKSVDLHCILRLTGLHMYEKSLGN